MPHQAITTFTLTAIAICAAVIYPIANLPVQWGNLLLCGIAVTALGAMASWINHTIKTRHAAQMKTLREFNRSNQARHDAEMNALRDLRYARLTDLATEIDEHLEQVNNR